MTKDKMDVWKRKDSSYGSGVGGGGELCERWVRTNRGGCDIHI